MNAYEKSLARTLTLLRVKPRTAKELAAALGCCKPAAYRRVGDLFALGLIRQAGRAKDAGTTGPAPLRFEAR